MMDPDTLRRRAALAAIFEESTNSIVERIAGEAARAGGLALAPDFVLRYSEGIRGMLPTVLEAVREPDPAVQASKLDGVAASTRAISDTYHVPRLIERGLLVVAFRFVSEAVRRNAAARGFTADELDAEVAWFQRELERRLG